MQILADTWLSEVMRQPVYKIEPSSDLGVVRETVLAHVRAQQAAMYYAKVKTTSVDTMLALARSGLGVVDVNVTLRHVETAHEARREPAPHVGPITPAEREAVLDIAETCFQYSRFHLDTAVPRETANRVKREWIASYIRGARGVELLVGRTPEKPAGFLAVLEGHVDGRVVRAIDLIGVRSDARRNGVARALVAAFVERHAPHADHLEVGTQVVNVPSLRLYQRCGFAIDRSAFVMHMHVKNGVAVA